MPHECQRSTPSSRGDQGPVKNLWKNFLTDEHGPTTVEYGILLGLIIVVSVGTLGGFGTGMHNLYLIISGALP